MKLNLLVLLADLFNLFEIHPANCVSYPGMDSIGKFTRKINMLYINCTTHKI